MPRQGVSILGGVGAVRGLSGNDTAALVGALDSLALAWDSNAVDVANTIFETSSYTVGNWREFWEHYFLVLRRPYTLALKDYLGYPLTAWTSATNRAKLQESLAEVLWALVDETVGRHSANLGAGLDDARTRLDVVHALRMVSDIAAASPPAAVSAVAYRRGLATVARWSSWLGGSATITEATNHYVPTIRALAQAAVRDHAVLDATTRPEMATAFGLGSGTRATLWTNHGLICHDNGLFSAAQLSNIATLFANIAPALVPLHQITQNDKLGNVSPRATTISMGASVNVFANDVGTVDEQQFPPDVPNPAPGASDLFTMALCHELTHITETLYVNVDSGRAARRDTVRSRPGATDLQYLRSQVGAAFFAGAPQEFVASIGNEWYSSSNDTFRLARKRADLGYIEPLNQFLWFAEMFSGGGSTTKFFAVSSAGAITVTTPSVERDGSGRINAITVSGSRWTFTLDGAGNPTAYAAG